MAERKFVSANFKKHSNISCVKRKCELLYNSTRGITGKTLTYLSKDNPNQLLEVNKFKKRVKHLSRRCRLIQILSNTRFPVVLKN